MALTLCVQEGITAIQGKHLSDGKQLDMNFDTRHFVGGEFVETLSSPTFSVLNPATNEPITNVGIGGAEDIKRAVESAFRAFMTGPWPRMSVSERVSILERFAHAIEESGFFLGTLEALNVGKLLKECVTHEAPRAKENFLFFAEEVKKVYADGVSEAYAKHVEFLGRKVKLVTSVYHNPVGVVGVIVPWNSPLLLGTWNIAPALAVGNTVVLKPPMWAPLSLLQLGRLANKAGIPPGVLNIVPGDREAGECLVRDPLVKRIAFTGGVTAGRTVQLANARTRFAPVLLELGGKAANIVFSDADFGFAIEGILRSAFRSQGQSCVAGSRLLVEKSIYDKFMARFLERVSSLHIGNQMDKNIDVGPLIRPEHIRRVASFIEEGVYGGARLTFGGVRFMSDECARGNYLVPTVFENVTPGMKIFQEEIFGPVLSVTSFMDEDESVLLANATRFGLSSNVWTEDSDRFTRIARKLEVGMVWHNSHFLRDLRAPFGGQKESGTQRAGGRYSLEFFTEPKALHRTFFVKN